MESSSLCIVWPYHLRWASLIFYIIAVTLSRHLMSSFIGWSWWLSPSIHGASSCPLHVGPTHVSWLLANIQCHKGRLDERLSGRPFPRDIFLSHRAPVACLHLNHASSCPRIGDGVAI
ncbi:hypothetical protein QQF64_025885 [Cirrhinus molitorella]|uniref:Uncharacterized protein n=1 Tax=Cirrhinus molitorella TaxID=172907 RepID=A0ABR3NQ86_9TELE